MWWRRRRRFRNYPWFRPRVRAYPYPYPYPYPPPPPPSYLYGSMPWLPRGAALPGGGYVGTVPDAPQVSGHWGRWKCKPAARVGAYRAPFNGVGGFGGVHSDGDVGMMNPTGGF